MTLAGIAFKKTAHAGAPGSRHNPVSTPKKLVFVDETGTSIKMARRSGRARRRYHCRAPDLSTPGRALAVAGARHGPLHGLAVRHTGRELVQP